MIQRWPLKKTLQSTSNQNFLVLEQIFVEFFSDLTVFLISLYLILHGFSHMTHTEWFIEVMIKQKNALHEEFNLSKRDVV